MQLGPSIFFVGIWFLIKSGFTEGTPVRVTINNKSKDLRIYNSFGEANQIGIHKKYLSYFEIKYKEKN